MHPPVSEVTQTVGPPALTVSARAIADAEVFDIGQFHKAEGMELADRH